MKTAWALGALLLAVLAAFGPILGHGFVFDDFALIVENAGVHGLDRARLAWMFATTWLTTYMPLGWASFAAVHAAAGLSPAAYHAANLGAHWLVCAALFAAARRLLRAGGHPRPEESAFLAALLFAVHPFQANTVAWAIELPDMLSTLFFLLAIFVYLGGTSRARVAGVFALYLVSLLFRWKSLSLPAVLVGLDYWPLGRLRARPGDPFDRARVWVWAEKAPFAVLAVAAASLTMLAKSREAYAAAFEPGAAARALWLYAGLLFSPGGYRAAYGLHGAGAGAWLALAGAGALTAWLWARRRERPWALLAWTAYAAAVLPPALSSQNGAVYVYLAYGYLGVLGLFVLAGSAARTPRAWAAVSALSLGLIILSRREIRHWSGQVAFWSAAVERDPGFSPARGELGAALLAEGRAAEALPHLEARLADAPSDALAAARKKKPPGRSPGRLRSSADGAR
ncbi:MAG: hypothetical protein M0D55_15700 [Elusimicrobiota bacterium]|nr:MAG: hypothetical protein M0D55_15700 [Elusimicrobiota bacterium]